MLDFFQQEQANPQTLWEGSLLLVDKPKTWTSFDVVNKIRYTLKIPKRKLKVGHAGTLDPLATGLLLICTGKYTKKINELQGLDKVYDGTIHLGATTPSYDAETEVDAEFDISKITEQSIIENAQTFLGKQEQVPPIYSAIKVDGERAYKHARAGESIELKKRAVEIFDFKIGEIDLPNVAFEVHCSKGTYIRSLAYDFGKRLDNGAYLSALRRTKVADYKLADAWNLDNLIEYIKLSKKELFNF